ncbi:MAG TPA: glycosyltransferase, partial [Syntrophomonas sp.]|nr:glycosyltransferase [Syntrophomonas sp.]
SNRPLILGTAGRLVPYKATVLALFTLKNLVKAGIDCHLRIAGTGALLQPIRKKATELDIERRVQFVGAVTDMPSFYNGIDIFILPSIREPLGLVAVEAMASGCPVIATAVDGIPEAVIDGKTGFCIQPEVTIQEFEQLAGTEFGAKLPETVYDPRTDQLHPPLAPDPLKLSQAIQHLIKNSAIYTTMSQATIETARMDFSFKTYKNTLTAALLQP